MPLGLFLQLYFVYPGKRQHNEIKHMLTTNSETDTVPFPQHSFHIWHVTSLRITSTNRCVTNNARTHVHVHVHVRTLHVHVNTCTAYVTAVHIISNTKVAQTVNLINTHTDSADLPYIYNYVAIVTWAHVLHPHVSNQHSELAFCVLSVSCDL